MGWISGIVVYLLVWWTILFAVLPWGVEPHGGEVAGAHPGAPQQHRMKQKIIATSLISALIWLVIYVLVASDIISFRLLAQGMRTT